MDPAIFPEEIWIQILLECEVPDIIALGSTCKYLRKTVDMDYLWKMKWLQLISKVQFNFPDMSCLQNLTVSFKAMCYRLHMILTLNDTNKNTFPKCYKCSSYTCERNCVEGSSVKVVIEIGNKYTWVIIPVFGLKRHFSMLGFPKYNGDRHIEQTPPPPPTTQNPLQKFSGCSNSRRKSESKFVTKKTIVKLLKLAEPEATKVPPRSGPFCVFCNSVQLYREKRRCEQHPNDASCYTRYNPIYQKLVNGYCTDTEDVLGIPNIDLYNPAEALLSEGTFTVVKDFVDHIFKQMGLTETLKKPNAVLVFCEPLAIHPLLRKQLLHYLFQEVKIARVCLVPKPLAACAMLGVENCIVVDSGSLSTTVAVVVDGQVMSKRWRLIPVGGWHVAYYLKQAISWQPKECHDIPITYLDYLAVKERCRLSLDIRKEEFNNSRLHKGGQNKAEKVDIDIRVDTYVNCKRDWRVSLGSERYTAPELMYVSLDLPNVIKEVTKGLPEAIKEDCFSNILLTGGNTDLKGFELRLSQDLKKSLSNYAHILDVKSCPGTHSWNVAMGSTYVPLAVHPGKTTPEYTKGTPFWLSREEYILFGCESLVSEEQ
ncbi:uncharacterized protein LOC106647531 [Copidosoma floridanum]|uniref:uncharacterized protein LOC106647531 n=1 Tax=Copidosoma floridanum TaxID=29053 RepID=UPI0006C9E30D|nr:uncharacterized protein LOC106647531 [Copidosoma floridanum]